MDRRGFMGAALLGLVGLLAEASGTASHASEETGERPNFIIVIGDDISWDDFQAHERSVRSRSYLYIRSAFPQLALTPPADVIDEGNTYRAMQKLKKEGKSTPEQLNCFDAPRASEKLYDIEADPHSLKNLVGDSGNVAVFQQMRQLMDTWVRERGNEVPADPIPDVLDRQTGKPLRR